MFLCFLLQVSDVTLEWKKKTPHSPLNAAGRVQGSYARRRKGKGEGGEGGSGRRERGGADIGEAFCGMGPGVKSISAGLSGLGRTKQGGEGSS
ncbi:hypothetical protein PUN28_011427 [Cardiocondyla obscurior]|uniref:Uncharacterized protein n=1 Tax=Cardiocondyla obscurior TaxID=286306 RepID=A0AAW2FFT0_9HYME